MWYVMAGWAVLLLGVTHVLAFALGSALAWTRSLWHQTTGRGRGEDAETKLERIETLCARHCHAGAVTSTHELAFRVRKIIKNT